MFPIKLLCLVWLLAGEIRTGGALECTGPNEYPDCGSACQTTCANMNKTCPIMNIKCNDACYCNKGYARNSSGICIPAQDCPK